MDVPLSTRRFILFTILASSFFINVDTGSIPAALLSIEEDLGIGEEEIALLNGITFFVCGILTIFTAPVMHAFDVKSVLIFSQMCNCVGSFMFLLSSDFYLLAIGRALNGVA